MRQLRLRLSYDGSKFFGWQRQPKVRTVQGEVERAILEVTRVHADVTASGRTDTGVHAIGQVASFFTECAYPLPVLRKALNAILDEDVCIHEIDCVPLDFDPIRCALRKRYRYLVEDSPLPDLFRRDYQWRIRKRMNMEAMRSAAKHLLGTHDFTAFQTSGSTRTTPIRTVYAIDIERRAAEFHDCMHVEVEADGFLYNMVRNIVGTLVQVGRGREKIDWPAEVLASRDRTRAGMTAPAQGLYLLWVKYDL